MKRVLYFAALVCLFGMSFCLMRWYSMPKNVSQTIEDVDNNDPAARSEVEDLLMGSGGGDTLLHEAGAFFMGVGVFFFVARRVR